MRPRGIVHIDLDAFYAQVEQIRLGIDSTVPIAVQQWQGIIAVNYPAKARNVKRGMNVVEARQKCPDLVFVHVPTYFMGETEYKYHENPKKQTHKVSLDNYRDASNKIMDIFRLFGGKFERASIDEAYFDFSDILLDDTMEFELKDTLVLGDSNNSTAIQDLLIYRAAVKARTIREKLMNELGYTCSAGISFNKPLAKLASSLNKPNKQTVVLESGVSQFLGPLSISKIPGLGGKKGDMIINDFKVETCKELWDIPKSSLESHSKDGIWIYNVCRGICNEAVEPPQPPKTLGSFKNMANNAPVTDVESAKKWIKTLCAELFSKVEHDFAIYGRWPKSLIVSSFINTRSHTKSTKFIQKGGNLEQLYNNAFKLLNLEYPITRLELTASGLDKYHRTVANLFKKNSEKLPKSPQKELENKSLDGRVCDKCQTVIFPDPILWQEHLDFHLAQELQDSFSKPAKKRKITDFFKKVT